MNELVFSKGISKYSLDINKIKYCIGQNFKEKYKFKQVVIECVKNYKTSEYSLENTGQAKMFLNNKEINNKNISFYQVDHNYSIQEDLKLLSKSLISKYLEILMSNNENVDTINTINILLESFGNELSDELIISRFMTYTPKLFLKILLPLFCIDEEQANEFDLDYDEMILTQLKMINYIAQNNASSINLCFMDIPVLTRKIKEYLEQMQNCLLIVLIDNFEIVPQIQDIYVFDKYVIDLNNEEELYNHYIHRGICTLKEVKNEMKIQLNNYKEKLDMSIFNKI